MVSYINLTKWHVIFVLQIKELGRPQNLARVSQETMGKMNRVIVNVVNKMKDIGQVSIMKRGKASLESTTASLAQSLAALGDQFDKTWTNLEVRQSVLKSWIIMKGTYIQLCAGNLLMRKVICYWY